MDLFEIEQTISPERQWRDLCESAGVLIDYRDDRITAEIDAYQGKGDNAFEAITELYQAIQASGKRPAFPSFDEWKLLQMRQR